MDKKILISLLIGALFFLILGGGLGIFYQSQNGALSPAENTKVEAVQTLSSKVIPSITAFGQVTKIDGRNVTLSFGGDNLTVKIRDDAQVYLPATSAKDKSGKLVTSQQQTAQFSDIKIGDNVSVNIKLLPDGQIEGQLVIILGAQK